MTVNITVPFGAQALVRLPDADAGTVTDNAGGLVYTQAGSAAQVTLDAGSYTFTYETTKPYTKIYSVECTVPELTSNPKTLEVLRKHLPIFRPENKKGIPWVDDKSNLEELLKSPFLRTPEALIEALDRELRQVAG